MEKNESNRQILTELSNEESEHYQILRKYTGQLPAPKMNKVRVYVLIARLFGLTFSIKLMEKGEEIAQNVYYNIKISQIYKKWPRKKKLMKQN